MKMVEWQDYKIYKNFLNKHKLKIASIEDLIAYRLKNEKLIHKISLKKINLKKNVVEFITYENKLDKV